MVGGLLLIDHWKKQCIKDANARMEPMRQEFERYIDGLPVQYYGVANDCDSGDGRAHLEARIDPSIPLDRVTVRFRSPVWEKRVGPGGRTYYVGKVADLKMEVHVSWFELLDPQRVVITVYPRQ
ncbi:Uncharacterised protein [Mycobacterium tuberculosis]|nr:Uncharacterised protein [Mycobacterium tuberculosis]